MKSKKNVLLSLSIFIAVVFVLTLFGQQPQKGALWDAIREISGYVKDHELRIVQLETDVADLRANDSHIMTRINALEARMDTAESNISNLINDVNALQNHTHDYSDLTGDLPSHTHDYSDISNPPSIPTEAEIIGLINEHALGAPDYDSWWEPIAQGGSETLILYHNLGGDHADYLVDLQFWKEGLDYHIAGYGGFVGYPEGIRRTEGALWWKLNNQSIRGTRHTYDEDVEWIRVRIWKY